MKIAVLLFGHLRTFEYCAPFLKKNILDKYDCDVFMHTWDEMDSKTLTWKGKPRSKECFNKKKIKQIKDFYNPKRLKIEHQQLPEVDEVAKSKNGLKEISLFGTNSMWYSAKYANNLRKEYEKENNIKYDIILATRPDIFIGNYIDIEAVLEEARGISIDIDNARFFAGVDLDSKYHAKLHLNATCDALYFAIPSVVDRYIETNQNTKKEEIDGLFNNFVQANVKKELAAGIKPYQIYFMWRKDWNIIRPLKDKPVEQKQAVAPKIKEKSKLYKFLHFYWLRGKK